MLAPLEINALRACAEQPRQVPAAVASDYPNRSGERLASYDDALGDNEAERVQMLE